MTDAAERAAARVDFQLTYTRSPQHRVFRPGELSGPDIPCAHGCTDHDQDGGWNDDRDLPPDEDDPAAAAAYRARTEKDWVKTYAGYALNEAVHEALEWLKVDGRPWLNPHGPAREEIYEAVNELVDRLAAIRERYLNR